MSEGSPRLATTVGLVAVGGAAGAVLRHLTESAFGWQGSGWPMGTFLANVAGCLLMGLFLGRLSVLETVPPRVTPLVTTGFLGGLTTFSTFAAEVDTLTGSGEAATAAAYTIISVVVGLAVVSLGWRFAQRGADR